MVRRTLSSVIILSEWHCHTAVRWMQTERTHSSNVTALRSAPLTDDTHGHRTPSWATFSQQSYIKWPHSTASRYQWRCTVFWRPRRAITSCAGFPFILLKNLKFGGRKKSYKFKAFILPFVLPPRAICVRGGCSIRPPQLRHWSWSTSSSHSHTHSSDTSYITTFLTEMINNFLRY
jgi:hypothetical protein